MKINKTILISLIFSLTYFGLKAASFTTDVHSSEDVFSLNTNKAIREGDLKTIRRLVNKENVNIKYDNIMTPLHKSIKYANYKSFLQLIILGGDINILSWNFQSALHLAVRSQSYEICKYIVRFRYKHSYNINHTDISGDTALDVAYKLMDDPMRIDERNMRKIINLLIKNGA